MLRARAIGIGWYGSECRAIGVMISGLGSRVGVRVELELGSGSGLWFGLGLGLALIKVGVGVRFSFTPRFVVPGPVLPPSTCSGGFWPSGGGIWPKP